MSEPVQLDRAWTRKGDMGAFRFSICVSCTDAQRPGGLPVCQLVVNLSAELLTQFRSTPAGLRLLATLRHIGQ